MASFGPTYWLWIPSIDRNLSLLGDGRLMDPNSMAIMEPELSQLYGGIESDARGFALFHCRDGTHLCLFSDYIREGGIESAKVVLVSEHRDLDGIELRMSLDRDGLTSISFDACGPTVPDDIDSIANAILEPVISLYHPHAHPKDRRVFGACKGTDRNDALRRICRAYEKHLVEAVTTYRYNSIIPDTYFEIKSCAMYGRSFLEKYGADIGAESGDLEYICRYASETADHTYLSREYRMNHGASENMASMNNRMFILMMLSIGMSFFAGSIFNDAIGDMSRPVWAVVGVVVFITAGYLGLKYARKRSEKEKDGLYME